MFLSYVVVIVAMSIFRKRIGTSTINAMNTIIVNTGYDVSRNSSYCKNNNEMKLYHRIRYLFIPI